MTGDKCPEWVPYGGRMFGGYTCNRPVKRDGLCGIHAAAEERAAAKRAKRRETWAKRRAASSVATDLAQSLTQETGVTFGAEFGGGVTLTNDNAELLLAWVRTLEVPR